jgi:glycosyltransferase involved in cell wall biosynthesis
MRDKPVLSFGLIAYNSERFIEEAIVGAFSQTYSPLEIILSDDFSNDGTFAIMQRMASRYRGSHRIVLNRNELNMGVAGHINRLFELAQGRLLVVAAADDVSLPNRVRATYDAWEKSNRKAACIYSGYRVIGSTSECLPGSDMEFRYGHSGKLVTESIAPADFFMSAKPWIFGCAAAYSPEVLQVFGPLDSSVVHDDDVLAFRATFLGPLLRLECPLVDYRLHESNIFGYSGGAVVTPEEIKRQEARSRRELETRYTMYRAFLEDLEKARAKSLISIDDFERVFKIGERKLNIVRAKNEFYKSLLFRRCALLVYLLREGLSIRELRGMATRLIPSGAFCLLKAYCNRLFVSRKRPELSQMRRVNPIRP